MLNIQRSSHMVGFCVNGVEPSNCEAKT